MPFFHFWRRHALSLHLYALAGWLVGTVLGFASGSMPPVEVLVIVQIALQLMLLVVVFITWRFGR